MRIDFPELGDGQYVVLRDPKRSLPWGVQRKIGLLPKAKDDKGKEDVSEEGKFMLAEILTMALVKEAVLLDPDGKPIPLPLTEKTIGDVASEVIAAVLGAFGDSRKGEIVEKVDPK